MQVDLEDFENGLTDWIHENYPKFKYDASYIKTTIACWIDDCDYEQAFLWLCKDYLENEGLI